MDFDDVTPSERSRMTEDGLHIVWRDDLACGEVKVRFRRLIEAGRGTTRTEVDRALNRPQQPLNRLLSWFGLG